MKLIFVTTNKHKFEEVKEILKPYPIVLTQENLDYPENHDASLEEIAREGARWCAEKLGAPCVVEDTGLYFTAYNNFPGALPKFVFHALSYKGIFKLLAEDDRGAYFKTVAALAEPGGEPRLFEGMMRGSITEEVRRMEADVMPYDRIFIPQGEERTISEMTMKEKNGFSQRAEAFHKLGEYIKFCLKADAGGGLS